MVIIGAGLAGLLCANVLRRMSPVVCEAQDSLPNNHHALLRFRTEECAKATGVPFKRVVVNKAVCYQGQLFTQPSIAFNNRYSQKVTGKVSNRSILKLDTVERFIAPDDFIKSMTAGVSLKFGTKLTAEELTLRSPSSEPAISTIPMPAMMDAVGWKDKPEFGYRAAWVVRASIPSCDVYQTLYYPGDEPYYRASLTGGTLIVEYLQKPHWSQKDLLSSELWRGDVTQVLRDFGIVAEAGACSFNEQKYGKLRTDDNQDACRRFILYLTDRYRIYSLGRFATWRNILLDDVVHDIRVIEKLIECRDGYKTALEQAR